MKKYLLFTSLFIIFLICIHSTAFATLGDLDGNDVVNATDYTMVVRYLKGYETLSEEQLAKADVDKNGTVNATDYTKVVRHLKGYEELEENAIYVSEDGNDETADGTTDKPYKTLTKAFEVSKSSGTTVKLLTDIRFTTQYTLTEGEYVLDLNGYKITGNYETQTPPDYLMFYLSGTAQLTINGDKEGSIIESCTSNSEIFFIIENAKLIINSGRFIDNGAQSGSYHSNVFLLRNNAGLEINGGYFESGNTAINVDGIDENNIVLNGGEFVATSPISLCDWGYGTRTQISKCLGEGKIIFDMVNNDIAQIERSEYWPSYEFVNADHIRIQDKGNYNLDNLYTIKIYDTRADDDPDIDSTNYEVLTYNNHVRVPKESGSYVDLIGLSKNKNTLNIDYNYNGRPTLTIENLNEVVDEKNGLALYEVWKNHNVIYDLNGGALQNGESLDGATSVRTGQRILLPTVEPVRENYVFGGWSIEKNDIYGKTDRIDYSTDSDIDDYIIYAVWLPQWFANAQKENTGNGNIYTINVAGQEELDELVEMIPYIKQFNDEGVAKYVFNVQNAVGATEDLKINKDITLDAYVTVKFNSNIILNANIEVKNGTSCSFGLNKITEEGQRSKVGFTGTGSIILSRCYECYIGNTLAFGTSRSAGMYGGTIVLSKDQETDELIIEIQSGTATIKNTDFGAVGLDFGFTIDYKLIVDEGATLAVAKTTNVTGEIINNGTININNGYSLKMLEGGKYTDNEIGTITGSGSFINN